MSVLMNTPEYLSVIENIKREITAAQYRAAVPCEYRFAGSFIMTLAVLSMNINSVVP